MTVGIGTRERTGELGCAFDSYGNVPAVPRFVHVLLTRYGIYSFFLPYRTDNLMVIMEIMLTVRKLYSGQLIDLDSPLNFLSDTYKLYHFSSSTFPFTCSISDYIVSF